MHSHAQAKTNFYLPFANSFLIQKTFQELKLSLSIEIFLQIKKRLFHLQLPWHFCGEFFVYPIPRRSQPHLSGKSRGGRLERCCHAWRSYSKWFLFRLAKKIAGEKQQVFFRTFRRRVRNHGMIRYLYGGPTPAHKVFWKLRMLGVERTRIF